MLPGLPETCLSSWNSKYKKTELNFRLNDKIILWYKVNHEATKKVKHKQIQPKTYQTVPSLYSKWECIFHFERRCHHLQKAFSEPKDVAGSLAPRT